MNLVIAFLAGMAFMWFCGYRLINRVYGKGKMLTHVLKNLNPDGFKRLYTAVDAERERRKTL
jgi:hypothetical protein